MSSIPPSLYSWLQEGDEPGLMTIESDGTVYKLTLTSLKQAQAVATLIDNAYAQGRKDKGWEMVYRLQQENDKE